MKTANQPNRTQAPSLHPLALPELLDYSCHPSSNGIEIYSLQDPTQEVFRLDISFEAGAYYQPFPLVASATLNMLNEGTQRHNSAELAEIFDFYGAYADFSAGMHRSEASLFSLSKYAPETIGLLGEMILQPVFPQKELDIYLQNKRQHFLMEKEKTSWLARKEFARVLFGNAHPYANIVAEKDYEHVSQNALLDFYQKYIHANKCRITLSGDITPSILKKTEEVFSALPKAELSLQSNPPLFTPSSPGRYAVQKKGSVQTSIRIGKKGVQLTDKDYAAFQLLNTVLGGYFGSRLMSNLREDKGYTYGVHSFNITFPLYAYWCIATDVNSECTEAAIGECLKEISILQTELVPEEELNLVKNYLYGDLLRELDGVFAQAEALKHKLIYQTDNQFYYSVINRIKECTAEELRELAIKYLPIEDLYIVTAGQ